MGQARVVEGGAGVTTLLRAALPAVPGLNLLPGIRKTGPDLDALVFTRPAVTIGRPHVDAYARVCGFPTKDTVPLPYPHLLAFPLHLRVMSDPAFPFAAMGAVHLANTLTGHRPVAVGETVAVTVRADTLAAHPKGRTVDVVTEVTSDGEPVWEARSTYLQRGRGEAGAPSGPVFDDLPGPGVTWRLPGDLGRQYAAVSGDRNPIHLYPVTAKALGFPRQIAHGMWSKARCIAALENRLPDAVTVEVAFRKPIFLPGTVAFAAAPTEGGFAFALTSPTPGSTHLQGRAVRA